MICFVYSCDVFDLFEDCSILVTVTSISDMSLLLLIASYSNMKIVYTRLLIIFCCNKCKSCSSEIVQCFWSTLPPIGWTTDVCYNQVKIVCTKMYYFCVKLKKILDSSLPRPHLLPFHPPPFQNCRSVTDSIYPKPAAAISN